VSCGFCQQQLYYKSPFTSHLARHHFGEGIGGEDRVLSSDLRFSGKSASKIKKVQTG
jgi:hypothetical protein